MAGVIVLDASVLIGYLDGDDVHHDRAVALLAREVDDDFAANSLTLAEVLVAPARADRLEGVAQALAELGVRELGFPAGTASELAVIRAHTRLKMPDCCVLLAAERARARLSSFDTGLIATARERNIVTLDR